MNAKLRCTLRPGLLWRGWFLAFSLAACAPFHRGQTAYGVSVRPPTSKVISGQCLILRAVVRNHGPHVRYLSLLNFTARVEMLENLTRKHIRISFEDRIPEGDPPHKLAPKVYKLRPLHALTLRIELPLPISNDPVELTWFSPPGGHLVNDLSPPFYIRVGVGVLPNIPDTDQSWWSDHALPVQRAAESEEIYVVASPALSDNSKCSGSLLEVVD